MTGYKVISNGDIRVHLYNSTDKNTETELKISNNTFRIFLSPYEVKSLRMNGAEMRECELKEY